MGDVTCGGMSMTKVIYSDGFGLCNFCYTLTRLLSALRGYTPIGDWKTKRMESASYGNRHEVFTESGIGIRMPIWP